MSKETITLIVVTGLLCALIFVLGVLIVRSSQAPVLKENANAQIVILGEKTHNWGKIDIDGGKVEKTFKIKNSGSSNLEVTNFITSCMCTEIKVSINGETSPAFGMNTRSGWKGVVEPGEIADINVIFDPMFHGPQGTGPVTRTINFNTNDSNNSAIELRVSGNVVRENN